MKHTVSIYMFHSLQYSMAMQCNNIIVIFHSVTYYVLPCRLLTLWFDYGHLSDVHKALMKGVQTIDIDTWLQVIPQLIARIDHPRRLVSRLIHDLLTAVGKQHPQVRLLQYGMKYSVCGKSMPIN